MRDPEGKIEFVGHKVIRHIQPGAAATPFLRSSAAADLVAQGDLIPYEFTAPNTMESPRLPFVSYPFEWCDAQLHGAGQLTLDISRQILSVGLELKDASSWNVIFQGNRPVFCDHLSFQPIDKPQWWALGQFTRHFLLPQAASALRGFKPHQIFSAFRDGIHPHTARHLFGLRRYLTRYWPLMLDVAPKAAPFDPRHSRHIKPMHGRLYGFCQFMLKDPVSSATRSNWSHYTET